MSYDSSYRHNKKSPNIPLTSVFVDNRCSPPTYLLTATLSVSKESKLMPPLCSSENRTILPHSPTVYNTSVSGLPFIPSFLLGFSPLLFLLLFSPSACCSLPQIMTIIPAQWEWPPPSHSHLCLSAHPLAAAHIHPEKRQQQHFPIIIILHLRDYRRCYTNTGLDFGVAVITWEKAYFFDFLENWKHLREEKIFLLFEDYNLNFWISKSWQRRQRFGMGENLTKPDLSMEFNAETWKQ